MWQGEEVVHDAIRDVLLARAAPAHVAAVLRRLGAVSEEVREMSSYGLRPWCMTCSS